jgi:flagellar motility protein MotE (MotC chaperone)
MIATILLVLAFAGIGLAGVLLFYARKKTEEANSLLNRSIEKWKAVKRDIETERREALLRVKDELYKKRNEFDLELKEIVLN